MCFGLQTILMREEIPFLLEANTKYRLYHNKDVDHVKQGGNLSLV